MFCKWCGNNIQLTDKKCPACGRETPPLSDCGGLYNLRHSDNGSHKPTCPRPVIMQCPIVEKMEPKYARDRKAAKNHHTITMVCFIAALLAIVGAALLVVRVNNQLGEIKEQVANIQIEVPTQPTENTVSEPIGNQQDDNSVETPPHDFVLDVTVTNFESPTISTAYNFGDYAKTGKVTTAVTESEKGQELAVSFAIAEDVSVALDLIYVQEETEALSIEVKCNSDLSLFDNQDFTYEWQYRRSIGSWTTVESDIVTQNNEDYSCIACTQNWLKTVCIMNQPVELRCNIQINNTIGDSMVITLGGISVAADGTIVTDNQ